MIENCLQKNDAAREKQQLLHIASYPGPAQLSVACSMEKQGGPGIFSHVSMMQSENGENLLK